MLFWGICVCLSDFFLCCEWLVRWFGVGVRGDWADWYDVGRQTEVSDSKVARCIWGLWVVEGWGDKT
jgi:hypothetical protein